MHRTNPILRTAIWSALLGVLLGGLAVAGAQAQVKPPARPTQLVLPINVTQRLQMTSKRAIRTVVNEKETIARVTPVVGDPTTVLLTGLDPGTTNITLTDVDNNSEVFNVLVQLDVEYLSTVLKRVVPTANIQPIPAANNTIVLNGTVMKAEDIDVVLRTAQSVVLGPDRIINHLSVGGVQQVQLCVVVARVSRSQVRRMSFTFLDLGQHHFLASTLGLSSSAQALNSISVQSANSLLQGGPGNIFLGLINDEQSFFGFLEALRDENVVKLLAEPRLITLSGRPASFLSGGEQAIPVPAGLGQVGVQFEEFGTRLNFLPVVLGNGRIHLEVEPEVSSLNAAFGTTINGTNVPGRDTQRVHTTVELEDGQTFVIGGLIQHDVTGSTTKVPIIGDLPFLGAAFSRKVFSEDESELLVVVTPHLVDAMACDQAPKIMPGQETRSPDDFELFLEGILEAPRGPREVCPKGRYVPAFKNGPTAEQYPCAGGKCGGGLGGCGTGGCGSPDGTCGTAATPAPASLPEVTPARHEWTSDANSSARPGAQ